LTLDDLLTTSTVDYPSDSWASCFTVVIISEKTTNL